MDEQILEALSSLTLKWYDNALISRKAIDMIVNDVNNFISTDFISFQKRSLKVRKIDQLCTESVFCRLTNALDETKNPLKIFRQRLSALTTMKNIAHSSNPKSSNSGKNVFNLKNWKALLLLMTTYRKSLHQKESRRMFH